MREMRSASHIEMSEGPFACYQGRILSNPRCGAYTAYFEALLVRKTELMALQISRLCNVISAMLGNEIRRCLQQGGRLDVCVDERAYRWVPFAWTGRGDRV